MRNYSIVALSIFICLQILISTSCKNEKNNQFINSQTEEEKLKEKTDSTELQNKIDNLVKPSRTDVTLIALKYRINDSIAEKLIWEYLKIHDELAIFFSALSDLKSNSISSDSVLYEKLTNSELEESKVMTIYRLSEKYNVSADTLASLIFDYKIWMANQRKSDNEY